MVSLAKDLATALGPQSVDVVEGADHKRITLSWDDGRIAQLDVYDGFAEWGKLDSPGRRRLMKAAHKAARELFPKHGVEYLLAVSGSERSKKTLERHGDWYEHTWDRNGVTVNGLRWDLV